MQPYANIAVINKKISTHSTCEELMYHPIPFENQLVAL